MTRPKRKYIRLASSVWAELRAYWEAGDHSLAELSDQYGVSARAIQSHLSKLGSTKGLKAAEMAASIQNKVFQDELGNQETFASRAKETREGTYANAKIIEDLVMTQLQLAQKEPTQAFKAATALKALSLAAAALERLHATKLRALGLDRNNALPDELPVLQFRDLSPADLATLHEGEDDEIGSSIVPPNCSGSCLPDTEIEDPDDIIIEAVDYESEKLRATSLSTHGGRLVRDNRHS